MKQGSGDAPRRQFVSYAFYHVSPSWRALPTDERSAHKQEVGDLWFHWRDRFQVLRTYSLIGMKADVDLMFWQAAWELETHHQFAAALRGTQMGPYLIQKHSYLAQTKRSQYIDKHEHADQEGRRSRIRAIGKKYLFVYPFVKTREWYLLPKDERQKMMDDHIAVGHRYGSVSINTSYSFGLDDQEFVVAFETDNPDDFLDLVMALREVKGSLYTLRDTPIFTCLNATVEEMLDALDGTLVEDRVQA